MYISHKYRFIFLRTPKTASSSLSEFFIRNIPDENAVYTPVDDTKIKEFATKWGIPYKAAEDYLKNANNYLAETTIDQTKIDEYAKAWKGPTDKFSDYKTSVTSGIAELNKLDYSSPGNSAASGWNAATTAAEPVTIR